MNCKGLTKEQCVAKDGCNYRNGAKRKYCARSKHQTKKTAQPKNGNQTKKVSKPKKTVKNENINDCKGLSREQCETIDNCLFTKGKRQYCRKGKNKAKASKAVKVQKTKKAPRPKAPKQKTPRPKTPKQKTPPKRVELNVNRMEVLMYFNKELKDFVQKHDNRDGYESILEPLMRKINRALGYLTVGGRAYNKIYDALVKDLNALEKMVIKCDNLPKDPSNPAYYSSGDGPRDSYEKYKDCMGEIDWEFRETHKALYELEPQLPILQKYVRDLKEIMKTKRIRWVTYNYRV